ncbi:MAG: DUF2309 domain-containing protein [Longimonas sp.]|uniref:DUF2309 domain-containing protein n=1 Tax=Longimonas sp. TaxID=2039626 RepID=UPI00397516D9
MRTDLSALRARVENAAAVLGRCWPLQSYIAANPLAGFEDEPFDSAVAAAKELFGGRGYPAAAQLRHAWTTGAIDPDVLADRLEAHGITAAPEAVLDQIEAAESDRAPQPAANDPLNRIMAKWLAAFLDQGQAAWPMPNRDKGFFAAWRAVAPYDTELPHRGDLSDVPERPLEALTEALRGYDETQWEAILQRHLVDLPGWASFIKWRTQDRHDAWQAAHPITLTGYLAARLHTARALEQPIAPENEDAAPSSAETASVRAERAAPWLEAWEATYREQLLADLEDAALSAPQSSASHRPDAQLVFCIDVRSEVIRRHLEQTGAYETFGYAGFFGLPMQYEAHGTDTRTELCPPIVSPKHRVCERPDPAHENAATTHDGWMAWLRAGRTLTKALKTNVAAAFGFVEAAGGFFGAALAARTLSPAALRAARRAWNERVPRPEDFCTLTIDYIAPDDDTDLSVGFTQREKVTYAEAAFRLMGWDRFAPVVVFTGHASETANNPYQSSLDCGACAGHPGGPNARALAAMCNEPSVRGGLRERGIDIPDDTVFLAAEHNTTTDAVTLFRTPELTDAQATHVVRLRRDLRAAQQRATAERAPSLRGARPKQSTADTQRRAADWAEARPEWGLSGNAAFIIGPRDLTAPLNLQGRVFLHAYDWQTDPNATALKQIMAGPLVVGEWINTQYYFSTVDNAVYGSGSKITQNVVGNMGVWQGNGGDLMTGLPLQSLQSDDTTPYHHPLRLMAVIQAPVARVEQVLDRNVQLRTLFDHEWMALAVMDPEEDNIVRRYQPGGTWETRADTFAPNTEASSSAPEPNPAPAV